MEIELKLLISPQHADKLLTHPLLQRHAADKPRQQELLSTYFDTPDLQVQQRQAALRVRKTSRGWLQTLKGGGKVEAGLHLRNEWEGPVDGPALDLPALRALVGEQSPWAGLLQDAALVARLEPVFTTRIARTIWNLHLPDGTQIECALDTGTVEHGDKHDAISELELELKAGSARQLFGLALQLLEDMPLRIGNISKAERGYRLYAPPPRMAAQDAAPLVLSPKMTVAQGFQAIVAACIAHYQANEAGVLAGGDTGCLHQIRIALHRLRSAFGLFDQVLETPQEIQDDFAWLARQLGIAGDWQAFAGNILASVDVPGDVRLPALQEAAVQIAAEQYVHAAATLVSMRATRLWLRLGEWLAGIYEYDAADDKVLAAPLRTFAVPALERAHHQLLERGQGLGNADAETRHHAHIAAKRAQCAAEFFWPLLTAKSAQRYVEGLVQLQKELGRFNDAAVAGELLLQLRQRFPELATDAACVRGCLHAQALHAIPRLHKTWKRVATLRIPKAA